jgi:hypothetical protein
MTKKNIVFLSYGNEPEYLRAIFCILSLSAWLSPKAFSNNFDEFKLIIYTDNPDFFAKHLPAFNIEFVFLSAASLEEMLDNKGFFHRRKVDVIDRTFKRYPDTDLLFIDTDTFFYADAEKLFSQYEKGTSFMHKREYRLAKAVNIFSVFGQEQHPKDFIKLIESRSFTIRSEKVDFTTDDYSWNSGVLGLSKYFAHYMPDVFRLTDTFYLHSKWFISEQLAFALILQKTTSIESTNDVIAHYWGKRQKALIDQKIKQLFSEKSPTTLINSKMLRTLTIKWQNLVANDVILEQAVLSLQQKYWPYGIKKALQILLKEPFNRNIYSQILRAMVTNPT